MHYALSLVVIALAVRGSAAAVAVEYAGLVAAAYPGGDCNTANFSLTRGCALTQEYWRTHNSAATAEELNVPWPGEPVSPSANLCLDIFRSKQSGLVYPYAYFMSEGSYYVVNQSGLISGIPFFAAGAVSPLAAMSGGPSACYAHAPQYIAAVNNLCSGACYGYGGQLSPVWVALELEANFLFGTHCQTTPSGPYNVSGSLAAARALLERYNSGGQVFTATGCDLEYGPYQCESQEDNLTATPCRGGDAPTDVCVGGCTYTRGYWKKNSLPSDETVLAACPGKKCGQIPFQWNKVCDLAWVNSTDGVACTSTVDPLSCSSSLERSSYSPYIPALTWQGVLNFPSNGDACIIAAKQLIPAELNIHCGFSCIPATVATAMAEAKAILLLECSDMTAQGANGLGPSVNNPNSTSTLNRRRLLAAAEILSAYNSGYETGPGHCGETLIAQAVEAEEVDVSNVTKEDVEFVRAMMTWILVFGVIVGVAGLILIAYALYRAWVMCMKEDTEEPEATDPLMGERGNVSDIESSSYYGNNGNTGLRRR
jgi:hypothetical protein